MFDDINQLFGRQSPGAFFTSRLLSLDTALSQTRFPRFVEASVLDFIHLLLNLDQRGSRKLAKEDSTGNCLVCKEPDITPRCIHKDYNLVDSKRNRLVKKNIVFIVLLIALIGCTEPLQRTQFSGAETPQATQTGVIESASAWRLYDPDSDHPWNRVFRQLYRRLTPNGEEYGASELDPLLWFDTTYLLDGNSYEQTIEVLDEFLNSHSENLIHDPLKRAMFQRDLWAVFDWLAWQRGPFPSAREALKRRLAQIMKRVALSKEEIATLPDNYALAVASKIYPTGFQAESPESGFLPVDIFQEGSSWVSLGRVGGPVAMTHTEAFPFVGRSLFLVFVSSPYGRAATLDFIESLITEPHPVTAIGSEVALVRKMLLIDEQGEIILSPLVETIQLRHFRPLQTFYEFELDRGHLFNGIGGGLVPNHDLFMLFMGHGDVFESTDIPDQQATIPDICKACHFQDSANFDSGSTQSIISYSRNPFSLPDEKHPVLFASTQTVEAQTVIEWKRDHLTWGSLGELWD
jgi:hypothetical protein